MRKNIFVSVLSSILLATTLLGCGGVDNDVISSGNKNNSNTTSTDSQKTNNESKTNSSDTKTITDDDSLWEKSSSEIKDFFSDKYICFGAYPQNGNKDQPIDWIVIDVDDDKQLYLLSRNVLEVLQYDSRGPSNATWKDSELRAFLNESFYDKAFNDTEKALIADSEVINDTNEHGIPGGENTIDKVFIPSVDELLSYVPFYEWDEETSTGETYFLMTYKTDHAVNYKDPKTGKKAERSPLEWEIWWLRLPKDDPSEISIVSMGPKCRVGNMTSSATRFQGVRPAIKIQRSSITYRQNEYYDSLVEKHNTARETIEKMERYFSSNLYLSSQQYYADTVKSLAPDKEFKYIGEIWLNYFELTDEELDTIIDNRETALKYFNTSGSLYVDYKTAELDPKVIIDEFIEAGISGSLLCIDGYDEDGIVDEWIINAQDGTVERYQNPGY